MINVGSSKDTIVDKKKTFKDYDDESLYNMIRTTVDYKTSMVTGLVKPFVSDADFCQDAPKNLSFFRDNLKYLGLEYNPQNHVDQVLRSLVTSYKDREAQGIFRNKWTILLLKPLYWTSLPFKLVGLID